MHCIDASRSAAAGSIYHLHGQTSPLTQNDFIPCGADQKWNFPAPLATQVDYVPTRLEWLLGGFRHLGLAGSWALGCRSLKWMEGPGRLQVPQERHAGCGWKKSPCIAVVSLVFALSCSLTVGLLLLKEGSYQASLSLSSLLSSTTPSIQGHGNDLGFVQRSR